ncbi:MAG: FeoA family protein [Jatrophihabitans sp.]
MFQLPTLRRHAATPSAYTESDSTITLADLQQGSSARIVDVCGDGDPAAARRLFDLGFAPDALVQMIRRAPLADPVIFRIAGYDVALRRAQARRIRVLPTL